jgi:hypothetical protein
LLVSRPALALAGGGAGLENTAAEAHHAHDVHVQKHPATNLNAPAYTTPHPTPQNQKVTGQVYEGRESGALGMGAERMLESGWRWTGPDVTPEFVELSFELGSGWENEAEHVVVLDRFNPGFFFSSSSPLGATPKTEDEASPSFLKDANNGTPPPPPELPVPPAAEDANRAHRACLSLASSLSSPCVIGS